jgi:hypothetical protein
MQFHVKLATKNLRSWLVLEVSYLFTEKATRAAQ